MRYRPELDGLRGIAVVAVLLYHAHVPGFAGGYLGVDVFFVISGYLITQLLETSADAYGPRTLREFYLRRARRLLPALNVVLAASAVAAAILFLPADLARFGRGLLLATAFLGNFGAWFDGGYFDPGWRFTPLRHLWSIGLEEQFYLLFPLFLFAVARLPQQRRRLVVAVLTGLSLALAVRAAARWPIVNYYMLPTRGWELLIGVLTAMSPQFAGRRDRNNQALSILSIIILAASIGFASLDYFPGIQTVAACVSTAILISCNSPALTGVGRALSWRPLVFTGLISYSLYLWHAPVLAFYSYYNVQDPGWRELAVILPAIYLVASLSWTLIEQPFRARPLPQIQSLLWRAGLPAAILLGGLGFLFMHSGGFPQRFASLNLRASTEEIVRSPADPACLNLRDQQVSTGALCSFGPADDTAPKVVVWGDSHAKALLSTYQALAETQRLRIYFGIKTACRPLLGAEAGITGNLWHVRCVSFNKAMAQAIALLRPQRVILNAYWLDPLASGKPELLKRLWQTDAAVMGGIERTLAAVRAAGATACAVLTVPGYPYPIPYALAMAQRRGLDPDTQSISKEQALDEYAAVEGDLRSLGRQGRLVVSDPKDQICPAQRCLLTTKNGETLYRDANHLSLAGSRLVTPALESCLTGLRR